MSFKEIKSLLRMVNVDMNDMYAYRLFKVGPCHLSDLCSLSSPTIRVLCFPFHPALVATGASCSTKATPGSTSLHPLPRGYGARMGVQAQNFSSPSGRPQG